ncbi:CLUMA_CG010576, isoform A [Clunio marinus]|uniref:CLUMA_CG010572, isoform A n=1 Tax=Clunio marinus TaxID=568069 RepID=A0A1J1IA62_9DIPT|nr:CLUMA_CG010572, isoform A [Clunio marinus]CRK97179.1 CLUMA_CG010576, isoform A [Clunio marinus]
MNDILDTTIFENIANETLINFNSTTTEYFTNNSYVNQTAENLTLSECGEADSDNELFEFWSNGILLNVVGVLGIFGNILSMIILSRPQMRSSINYLLIGLARCDTILILTSMLLFGVPAIYPYTGYLRYYSLRLLPEISQFVYPIAMTAQTASVYLTLTVTLERYVAVCHPLRARALCTYGRARLYVVVIIAFSFLYNIPRFFEVELMKYSDYQYGYVYCISASKLRAEKLYINIYIHWLYLIFIYFIPFLSITFFNAMIYRQVRRANRERQRLSRTEKREIGLATMLFCVVIVFICCNILALLINIIEAFTGIIYDPVVKTSNLLVTINSSVNFIIYVIFGEKFKRIFLQLFCKFRRVGRDSPEGFVHDDSSFSNGDASNRNSGRFQRSGTTRSTSRNGTSIKTNRITRTQRAPSPGPIVYYPARETLPRPSAISITRSTSLMNADWEREDINGNALIMTSGF